MNTRSRDGLQTRDRLGELSLERMLIARAFHELADTETRILRHDSEAAVAFRKSLPCELQPRIVNAIGRHGDFTVVVELVRNAAGLQRLCDLRGVRLTQIPIQQAVRRFLG